MQTALVTADGFPRADIDVAQIRTTRSKMICLRNDYKALMRQIEDALHEHHANLGTSDDTGSANAIVSSATTSEDVGARNHSTVSATDGGDTESKRVFAKVNSVVDASPAHLAGLQANDLILQFGDVDYTNHENLTRVAQVVKDSEGQEIRIVVQRVAGQNVTLVLVPRRDWGGRGSLGCHLLPV